MSDRAQTALDIAEIASKTTYVGGYGGAVAWLFNIDWLPCIGLLIAFFGFVVNLYFKRLENKRAEEIHRLKMQEYRKNEIN